MQFTAFYLQDATMATDVHWIAIGVGIIAAFFLLLIIGIVVAGVFALIEVRRLKADFKKLSDNVSRSAMPIVQRVTDLVADLDPKIRSISSDAQHISSLVRAKVEEAGDSFSQINGTVKDANAKTQAQVTRVNGIVSHAITATEEITHNITENIRKPVRKAAEVISSMRIGLEDLSSKVPHLFASLIEKASPRSKPAPTPKVAEVVVLPVVETEPGPISGGFKPPTSRG